MRVRACLSVCLSFPIPFKGIHKEGTILCCISHGGSEGGFRCGTKRKVLTRAENCFSILFHSSHSRRGNFQAGVNMFSMLLGNVVGFPFYQRKKPPASNPRKSLLFFHNPVAGLYYSYPSLHVCQIIPFFSLASHAKI